MNKQSKIKTYPAAAIHFKEVGDGTTYFGTVSKIHNADGDQVYVSLGGYGYAPEVGGFFPRFMLIEFDQFVQLWYAEELRFADRLEHLPEYGYMLSKQRSSYASSWNMAVAIIIAWLAFISDGGVDWTQDEEALQIIGAFYRDRYADAAPILAKLGIIEHERT